MDRAARLVVQDQSAAAIPLFHKALRLEPSNPKAHYGLGLACLNCRHLPEAAAAFRQATLLEPGYVQAHFNLAIACDLQGHAHAAIDSYRAATVHAPNLVEAHDRMGELLTDQGKIPEAIESYRAAAAASPGTTTGRLNEGRVLLLQEDFAAAKEVFRRTVALDPTCAKAFELLGFIDSSNGGFDTAVGFFDQALAVDPRQIVTYLSLVAAKKITQDDAALVGRMAALSQDRMLSDPERVMLHFALGKAMDDLRDYGEAMRNFDAANRIRSPQLQFDRRHLAQRIDRMIATFTADAFAGNRDLRVDDRRPVLILGMPRSGTTLVEQIISSHPTVAGGGELTFWMEQGVAWEGGKINPLSPDGAGRIAANYRALLNGISAEAARITDKMPFNFYWAGLIHTLFPNATIIHCRRNPVDVCLSIYTKRFQTPMVFAAERRNLVHFYREYQRLMQHWRAVLPADRFLEVDYDTLVGAPEAGTRQLIAFCGLEWDDACLRPELNERVVRTASSWQVRQPINKSGLERWRRYEPWLGELKELLPSE